MGRMPRGCTLLALLGAFGCQKSNPSYGQPATSGTSSSGTTGTTTLGSTSSTGSSSTVGSTTTTPSTTSTTTETTGGSGVLGWRQTLEIQPLAGDFTELLQNVPVLVELTPDDFAYGDAAADGSDLRFFDTGDNLLPHEIESFDPGGSSRVWVQMPTVEVAVATPLTLEYGFASNDEPLDPAEVWSAGYAAVYHFEDASSAPQQFSDSGLFGNLMTANGLMPLGSSPWGQALSVAQGENASAPASESFDIETPITLSVWVRPATVSQLNMVYREIITKQGAYRLGAVDHSNDGGPLFLVEEGTTGTSEVAATSQLMVGTWQHVAATHSGTQMRIYVDGTLANTFNSTLVPNINGSIVYLGRNYSGDIDEARIASALRSDAWIAFQYQTMQPGLVTFSEPIAIPE